jgi:hypothetical protein
MSAPTPSIPKKPKLASLEATQARAWLTLREQYTREINTLYPKPAGRTIDSNKSTRDLYLTIEDDGTTVSFTDYSTLRVLATNEQEARRMRYAAEEEGGDMHAEIDWGGLVFDPDVWKEEEIAYLTADLSSATALPLAIFMDQVSTLVTESAANPSSITLESSNYFTAFQQELVANGSHKISILTTMVWRVWVATLQGTQNRQLAKHGITNRPEADLVLDLMKMLPREIKVALLQYHHSLYKGDVDGYKKCFSTRDAFIYLLNSMYDSCFKGLVVNLSLPQWTNALQNVSLGIDQVTMLIGNLKPVHAAFTFNPSLTSDKKGGEDHKKKPADKHDKRDTKSGKAKDGKRLREDGETGGPPAKKPKHEGGGGKSPPASKPSSPSKGLSLEEWQALMRSYQVNGNDRFPSADKLKKENHNGRCINCKAQTTNHTSATCDKVCFFCSGQHNAFNCRKRYVGWGSRTAPRNEDAPALPSNPDALLRHSVIKQVNLQMLEENSSSTLNYNCWLGNYEYACNAMVTADTGSTTSATPEADFGKLQNQLHLPSLTLDPPVQLLLADGTTVATNEYIVIPTMDITINQDGLDDRSTQPPIRANVRRLLLRNLEVLKIPGAAKGLRSTPAILLGQDALRFIGVNTHDSLYQAASLGTVHDVSSVGPTSLLTVSASELNSHAVEVGLSSKEELLAFDVSSEEDEDM